VIMHQTSFAVHGEALPQQRLTWNSIHQVITSNLMWITYSITAHGIIQGGKNFTNVDTEQQVTGRGYGQFRPGRCVIIVIYNRW
jgi:hypothetical protein